MSIYLILRFAVPLLFGLLFRQFYSVVDTMIVGKFLRARVLAAGGSTDSVNFLVIGFCVGICNGFVIPVAQQFGGGRYCLCGGNISVDIGSQLFFMKKKYEILKIAKEEWHFDAHYAMILCGMGILMGLQYSITAIGSVVLQTAVNSLGSVYVSSMTAASKISGFFWLTF